MRTSSQPYVKEITTAHDITDTLAESFLEISSTINYTTKY